MHVRIISTINVFFFMAVNIPNSLAIAKPSPEPAGGNENLNKSGGPGKNQSTGSEQGDFCFKGSARAGPYPGRSFFSESFNYNPGQM